MTTLSRNRRSVTGHGAVTFKWVFLLGLHRWWSVDDEGAYDGISPFWRRIR